MVNIFGIIPLFTTTPPPPQHVIRPPVTERMPLHSKSLCKNVAHASGGGGGVQTEKIRRHKLYTEVMKWRSSETQMRSRMRIQLLQNKSTKNLMNLFRLPPPVAKLHSTRQYIVNQHVYYSKGVRKRELV